jgi:hypothetical protein
MRGIMPTDRTKGAGEMRHLTLRLARLYRIPGAAENRLTDGPLASCHSSRSYFRASERI